MATTILAGNATNGLALTPDNTGILEIKTGTGAGTTALTLDASQNATVAGTLTVGSTLQVAGVTTNMYPLVSGTAVTASGTSVNFTGIPPWAKRITVMYAGVSTNGTSTLILQLGTSGGIVTSGYVGAMSYSAAQAIYTTGIGIHNNGSASGIGNGITQVSLIGSNTWAASGTVGCTGAGTGETYSSGSSIILGGTLTQVRIIGSNTGSPVDTFDAGTINIMWE